MSRARLAVAAAIAAVFVVRAVTGVPGGIAYSRGAKLAGDAAYAAALPLLEHGSLGSDRCEALWLRAQVRLGIWDQTAASERASRLGDVLAAGATENLLGFTQCPASPWFETGLAEVYDRVERHERRERAADLSRLDAGPWAFVGRPGRVAIGLLRNAIARQPKEFSHRDRLVRILLDYGLRDEALREVRATAAVMPAPQFYAFVNDPDADPEVLRAFAEASRSQLGKSPFVALGRHLVALGKLEKRLGERDLAERDLRESLRHPATPLQRAESWFWLGLVLADRGADDEAERAFLEASSHPTFEVAGLVQAARTAERGGRLDSAAASLQKARRADPGSVDLCLAAARVEERRGNLAGAKEALRWARIVAPLDARPIVAWIELDIRTGDLASAESRLRELERVGGEEHEVARLRDELGRKGDGS